MKFYEAVEKYPRTISIVDVEASCYKEKDPKNINEIIEIGVAQINDGKIKKMEPIIVQPQFSKISEFCTSLTHITQEMVDKGDMPSVAYPKMEKMFLGDTWASYGKYDLLNMMTKMSEMYKINIVLPSHHINIRELFAVKVLGNSDPNAAPSNPKDAMQQIGLDFEGQNHRGGDDAYNIARLYLAIIEK